MGFGADSVSLSPWDDARDVNATIGYIGTAQPRPSTVNHCSPVNLHLNLKLSQHHSSEFRTLTAMPSQSASRWETMGEAFFGSRTKSRAREPTPSDSLHFADVDEIIICRCQSSKHRHNSKVRDADLLYKSAKYFHKHPDKYECMPKALKRLGKSIPQCINSVLPELSHSDAEMILAKTVFDAKVERGLSPRDALAQTSDYMHDKRGKRPASQDVLIFAYPLTPADFDGSHPSNEVIDDMNPFNHLRSIMDALPRSSRSATASSGRRGRSYTVQSSSSRRGRSCNQNSSGPRERSRHHSKWETNTLPWSAQKYPAPSGQHVRSRSDYSSPSRRERSPRRQSPQTHERRNNHATRPHSDTAERAINGLISSDSYPKEP